MLVKGGGEAVVLDAPLLFETGLNRLVVVPKPFTGGGGGGGDGGGGGGGGDDSDDDDDDYDNGDDHHHHHHHVTCLTGCVTTPSLLRAAMKTCSCR